MMFLCVLILFLVTKSFANISPNYYCADMNPQQHVNIEQLMGMWYGIEVIPHNIEEQHYVEEAPSCPILHLSEDKNYGRPYNTLHREHDYSHNYGERRDYNQREYDRIKNQREYDRIKITQREYDRIKNQQSNERQQLGQQYSDVTKSPYDSDYDNTRYGTPGYKTNKKMYQDEWKRLRIWWDENGSGTEYHLRYNITRPGFWLSAGPQNGSELEPQFSHFAGTVQVIKAVGNHLVLTFCHQLPDRDLFTILLSRENKLDYSDIHGVHSLLNRRGLATSAIKKVCSNGSRRIEFVFGWLFVSILSVFLAGS